MTPPRVLVKVLPHGEGLALPAYQSHGSAGADVRAAVTESVPVAPGARVLVPCGFAIALPQGYECQVRPRSGLAVKRGVTVLNAPGTIDADYRGEVMVVLVNHGSEPFVVERGMRVAQLVVAPVVQVDFTPAATLDATERSAGGFGSTGAR